jgi:hypothetical protein
VSRVVDPIHNKLEETNAMHILKIECGARDIFLSLDFSQASKRMIEQLCRADDRGG